MELYSTSIQRKHVPQSCVGSTYKDSFKPLLRSAECRNHLPSPASIFPKNDRPLPALSLTKYSFRKPGIASQEKEKNEERFAHDGKKERQSFANITKGMINPDRRIETKYATTMSEFYPKVIQVARVHGGRDRHFAGSQQLGNSVLTNHKSDYSRNYHQGVKVDKAKCFFLNPDPVFTAGKKLFGNDAICSWSAYSKWHADRSSSPLKIRRSNDITSIPIGDPIKLNNFTSSHKSSYKNPYKRGLSRSDIFKEPADISNTFKTSFSLGDRRDSHVRTTTMDHFSHDESGRPSTPFFYPRNASSFPEGDLDPERVQDRLNYSSSKTSHPLVKYSSPRLDTSGWRFHSSIHFEKSDSEDTGKSEMSMSYPKHATYAPRRSLPFPQDTFQIHIYPKETGQTLAKESYDGPDGDGDTSLVDYLKQPHWNLHCMEPPTYYTTYGEDFKLPQICH